jgi:hypothetical protein
MKVKINLNEGHDFYIHNEEEQHCPWSLERECVDGHGYDKNVLRIDIKIETLNYLIENDHLIPYINWLKQNAETYLRAEAHRQEELEKERETEKEKQYQQERAKPKQIKKREGFVYLLEADNGLCKIGRAVKIDERVHRFEVKLPMKTRLLHSFYSENYVDAELELQTKYESFRDHGEWFHLTEKEIAEIRAIN